MDKNSLRICHVGTHLHPAQEGQRRVEGRGTRDERARRRGRLGIDEWLGWKRSLVCYFLFTVLNYRIN